MSTKKERKKGEDTVLAYYQNNPGLAPTSDEIAKAIGLSKSYVDLILYDLTAAGVLVKRNTYVMTQLEIF